MDAAETPRGLICSLALVPDPKNRRLYLGLESLIARVHPAVTGIFLDPMFWCPGDNSCGPVSSYLLEEVIGLIRSGIALWVRITGTSAEQTLHIRRQLETVFRRLNYYGPLAWVDTPLFYHSNRGLPEHYQSLLADTEFNLILDNDPQLIRKIGGKTKRRNIRTSVLKKLVQQRGLAALIHRGDLRRSMHYQRAVRNRPDFLVYDGVEGSFLKRPSSSGVVSVGANLLPYEWKTITLASLNLEESQSGSSARFRVLWEAGQRVRTLHTYYALAPGKIISAVLAAWGVVQQNEAGLTSEQKDAMNKILEHIPRP